MGNLNSIKKVIDRLRIASVISSQPEAISRAKKIILPGIGHFGKAMNNLRRLDLLAPLNEAILIQKKPVLGICLGMQLFAKKSAEGEGEGLNWIDAEVVKFDVSDKFKFKVPHMGWNQVFVRKDSLLMRDIPLTAEFYFAHSYYLKIDNQPDLLSETRFDRIFASAVEKENIFGVQFHPEKSHDVGARLLKNFVEM